MGRIGFSATRVHEQATRLLQLKRIPAPPPWYAPVASIPPPQRLIRPAMQRPQKAGKKASRMFQPVKLEYQEDKLRWEYFNDHPWELARPRVILENDGKDHAKWDWSLPLDYCLNRPRSGTVDEYGRTGEDWDVIQQTQAMRPINGEAVIQRQMYLLSHSNLDPSEVYDLARKELYRYRHSSEIEVRVAREEAQYQGAYFGPGPLEIGNMLENRAYKDFTKWAANEAMVMRQQASAANAGDDIVDSETNEELLGGGGATAQSSA